MHGLHSHGGEPSNLVRDVEASLRHVEASRRLARHSVHLDAFREAFDADALLDDAADALLDVLDAADPRTAWWCGRHAWQTPTAGSAGSQQPRPPPQLLHWQRFSAVYLLMIATFSLCVVRAQRQRQSLGSFLNSPLSFLRTLTLSLILSGGVPWPFFSQAADLVLGAGRHLEADLDVQAIAAVDTFRLRLVFDEVLLSLWL